MNEIVYLNGALIPRHEAKISVMDYGFLFGYGLFETMRAYNGLVFRLDSHLSRLERSAEILGISVDTAASKQAVRDTIRANQLFKDARVRLAVSIGEGSLTPDPRTCVQPTVLVSAAEYHPYAPEVYDRGFTAVISSIRRNSQSLISRMKTAGYLENLLARQEARAAGKGEALFLNEKGCLCEASSSNVFIVSKNELKTPKLESGALPGITRGVVLELAPQLSIKALEAEVSLEELMHADEAFLTNSMMEVMPLVEAADNIIGTGKPGTVTKLLMSAYRGSVISETELQR